MGAHSLSPDWLYRVIAASEHRFNLPELQRRIGVEQAKQLRKGTTMDTLTRYAKAVVALAGSLLMIWNEYSPGFADVLPASWSHGITIVVGILTAVATFGVPNTTTDPVVAASQSVQLRGRHELPE